MERTHAKKRASHGRSHHTQLGQHFLTRPEIAGRVADAVPLEPNTTVLEVGPGHGILTHELLARVAHVVAVEKDPALIAELDQTFAEAIAAGKLVLLQEDIRNVDPMQTPELAGGYVVVANIPYYLTGYLVRKFLTVRQQPTSMSLLVQKEVAERVVAKDGKESLLSLSVKAYGKPHYVCTVKAGSFSPPPNVDSAILTIEHISREHFAEIDEQHFFKILRTGFANKRKLLASNVRGLVPLETVERCNVQQKVRAEELSLHDWLCLARVD